LLAVLDASAMLAYLLDEPGGAVVEEAMLDADAFLSTVNEAEVLTRLARLDESLVPRIAQGWRPAGAYRVEAFTELDAARAAQLYPRTLGRSACLSGTEPVSPSVTDSTCRS